MLAQSTELPLFDDCFVFNPSVRDEDIERLTEQARAVYDRLRRGAVLNTELSRLAMQYNARIYEIREMLKPYGLTVNRESLGDGINRYKIGSKTEAGK